MAFDVFHLLSRYVTFFFPAAYFFPISERAPDSSPSFVAPCVICSHCSCLIDRTERKSCKYHPVAVRLCERKKRYDVCVEMSPCRKSGSVETKESQCFRRMLGHTLRFGLYQ